MLILHTHSLIYPWVYTYWFMFVGIYIYIYMYIHMYINVHVYVCTDIGKYIYIYIYKYTCVTYVTHVTHVYLYIYLYVCVYMYICICMYICVYILPNALISQFGGCAGLRACWPGVCVRNFNFLHVFSWKCVCVFVSVSLLVRRKDCAWVHVRVGGGLRGWVCVWGVFLSRRRSVYRQS